MSTGMYKVKPFYDPNEKVELPQVMYKVNSVYGSEQTNEEPMDTSDPLTSLSNRQEAILSKLGDLKRTLDDLSVKYQATPNDAPVTMATKQGGSASLGTQGSGVKLESPLGNGVHDIVINANPSSPPLSLFVLYERLKQQYKVLATSYIHSSVNDVSQKLCDMIRNGCQVTRGSHQVALSVIWKQVENGPHLMISPTKQSTISGEVNIARYINRILDPAFDTEDIVMATNIDEWLDVADSQILNGNSKQKTAALKNINNRLKRNDWLVGSSLSLADIVMWSAISQSKQSPTESVAKWMSRCSAEPLFQTAASLL